MKFESNPIKKVKDAVTAGVIAGVALFPKFGDAQTQTAQDATKNVYHAVSSVDYNNRVEAYKDSLHAFQQSVISQKILDLVDYENKQVWNDISDDTHHRVFLEIDKLLGTRLAEIQYNINTYHMLPPGTITKEDFERMEALNKELQQEKNKVLVRFTAVISENPVVTESYANDGIFHASPDPIKKQVDVNLYTKNKNLKPAGMGTSKSLRNCLFGDNQIGTLAYPKYSKPTQTIAPFIESTHN